METTNTHDNQLDTLEHGTNSEATGQVPVDVTLTPSLVDTALEYLNAGLAVIPVNQKKRPTIPSWTEYQLRLPTEEEIRSWRWDWGMTIICGKVSGSLELIDYDEKYNIIPETLFDRWKQLVDEQAPGLVDRLVLGETQSLGYHAYYRSDEVEGNTKLAEREVTQDEKTRNPRARRMTLIETRGEGGYAVCPPSAGYRVIQGSLLDIPKVTPEEQKILKNSARMINEVFDKPVNGSRRSKATGDRPGDIFNATGSIEDVLVEAGWTKVGQSGENERWCRPGKHGEPGATYHQSKRTFYVFTSNAAPFEPMKCYTPFAVYALLRHDGDFKAASRALAGKGFGTITEGDKKEDELQSVEEYLASRYDFRFNKIRQVIEWRVRGTGMYQRMDERQLNTLHRELIHNGLWWSRDGLSQLLESEFTEAVDPFVQYFMDLKSWDGVTDHIEQLARTVALARPEELPVFVKCLKKWFIAQVACAVDEQVVNHTAIILVGDQGDGKTSWLNRFIPPSLSSYKFVGTINPENKDTLIFLSETMLINLDELETLRKAAIGSLKSVMSLDAVNVRRPYARYATLSPRRASFVGSINHDGFLTDPTGSRRFLTFGVKSVDYEHTVDMDGLYSQAYALYLAGERFWFTQDEIKEVNERNRRHAVRSYEHEVLNERCHPGVAEQNDGQWYTSTELARAISNMLVRPSSDDGRGVVSEFKVDDKSTRALGIALSLEGYRKKKTNGATRYYVAWGSLPSGNEVVEEA